MSDKDKLLAALKPFADFLDGIIGFAGKPQSGEFHTISFMKDGVEEIRSITIENFKDARAALEAAKTLAALEAQPAMADGWKAAFEEALKPSGETKAAYIGEFSFNDTREDADGEVRTYRMVVPWTTIKEIMKAIKARALAAAPSSPAMERREVLEDDATVERVARALFEQEFPRLDWETREEVFKPIHRRKASAALRALASTPIPIGEQ